MAIDYRSAVRTGLRLAAVIAVAVGIVLVVLYRSDIEPGAIRDAIKDSFWAPVLFLALQVIASVLFVPRSVMGAAAGLLFGMWWGMVWAMVGAALGAGVGFALVRWLGEAVAVGTAPSLRTMVEKCERGGWRAVAIIRLAPLPHSLVNSALALTKIGWRDYLVGSMVGMLPTTLAQVGVGAAGGAFLMGSGGWILATVLLAGALIASLLIKRALKE